MFWKKAREIDRLNEIIDENEEEIDRLIEEKTKQYEYICNLEGKLAHELSENEKLSNAMKEYGDLEMKNINIPYHIEKREMQNYEINNYGGGQLRHTIEKTKIIPQIIIHYIEEE